MKKLLLLVAFGVLVSVPLAHARSEDPAKPPQRPAPSVYDESADARVDLKAALERAKRENRRVLVQWGANWCGWCVALHGTMTKNADVSRKLQYEYDVVRVDIGQWDKNVELAQELGAELKANGVPYLTVLDADGKVLVNQPSGPLELGSLEQGHDAKKLVEFLTAHQAPPLDAAAVRTAALARAKAENKRVFLHFGAPWCPWCHELESWMARPDVAEILSGDFVDAKIDTDRMTGGADSLKAARTSAGVATNGGVPWFVFLDADGKVLASSEGPSGNVGFPTTDAEIEHFAGMLAKCCVNTTPAGIDALRKSLIAVREEREAKQKALEAGASK